MTINGLEQKILSLADVKKVESKDSKELSFKVGEDDFINVVSKNEILLFLNEACKKKLDTALKSEQRACFDKKNDSWVHLKYESEVDVEFIFLYIRYSWKFLRADSL